MNALQSSQPSVEAPLEEGLTWRSILALVYSSMVLLPIGLYSSLVAPIEVGTSIVLILFIELARLSGKPLRSSEAFLMSLLTVTAMTSRIPWLGFVQNSYTAYSSLYRTLGYSQQIPSWWAPSETSAALTLRLLWHSDFNPILTLALVGTTLQLMQEVALSRVLAELYINVENLPFPSAQYQAQTILALTERVPDRFRVFMLGSLFGFIYGLFLYGIPNASQAVFGVKPSIPGMTLPWNDYTAIVERVLPGASFGVAPDPMLIAPAWIISSNVVIPWVLTSFALYFFGNAIALSLGGPMFAGWVEDWYPGAGVAWNFQRSYLKIWLNVYIGFAVVAGVMPIIVRRKAYAQAFKGLLKPLGKARYSSLTLALGIYFICAVAALVIFHTLIPGFPFWVLIPFIFWELIWAFVAGWGVGTTGLSGAAPPYLREATIFISGYKGLDVWFGPWIPAPGTGAALLVNNVYKVGALCKCKPSSYFKGLILAVILSSVFGFLYVQMFWSMAPIPSAAYPQTEIAWPVAAIQGSFFLTLATKGMIAGQFNPNLILGGFVTALGIFAGLLLAKQPIHSFIGIVAGFGTAIPTAFSLILGLITGKSIEKIMGRTWWNSYKAVLIGGIGLGEGVIIAISAGLLLASKGIWFLPY